MKFKDLLKTVTWNTKLYVLPLYEKFEPIRDVRAHDILYSCNAPADDLNVNKFLCLYDMTVRGINVPALDELTVFI